MTMIECTKCQAHDLRFRRNYEVAEFLEGYIDSAIWIIGLNPAAEQNWNDARTVDQLQVDFYEHARSIPYFRDFNRVSPWLFDRLGKPGGVAHTDLVKCSSRSWPPGKCSNHAAREIVSNCAPYLLHQIEKFKPRLIICNGTDVSSFIKTVVPPENEIGAATSYCGSTGGRRVWVVLSGFIGRIDNYARRRLGREIEQLASSLGIGDMNGVGV